MNSQAENSIQSDAKTVLTWFDLPSSQRAQLHGKLAGLWGAASDQAAFDSLSLDKQQALLLLMERMQAHGVWQVVRRIDNVYGEGGVGCHFTAWPFISTTLKRHPGFTRRLARHSDTSGGFYEKGRARAVLHFLYQEGNPRRWYVHFDFYSPVFSPASAFRHFRYEYLRKFTPDWRLIREALKAED